MKSVMVSAVLAVMLCGGAWIVNAVETDRPFATIDDDGVIRVSRKSLPSPEISKIWNATNVPAKPMNPIQVRMWIKKSHAEWEQTKTMIVKKKWGMVMVFLFFAAWILIWGLILKPLKHVHVPGKHSHTSSRDLPATGGTGRLRWRGPL